MTTDTKLQPDVRAAIDTLWPGGVVDLSFDEEESYFAGIQVKLGRDLRRIPGSRLLHEREAAPEPAWRESDPDEDPPDETSRSRSYHSFFLRPDGADFTFESETEGWQEDLEDEWAEPSTSTIRGEGSSGWVVAVSLLAPFAVIEFADFSTFEDGSCSEPELDPFYQDANGKRIDPEQAFRAANSTQTGEVLTNLHKSISEVLAKYGISVLPRQEWSKPVPRLTASEGTIAAVKPGALRVLDAFFLEEIY